MYRAQVKMYRVQIYTDDVYTAHMTVTLLDVKVELVGPAELTQMLGVSRTRFVQIVGAPGFPEPLAELVMGKIWDLAEIREWAAQSGRELKPVTKTAKANAKA